MLEFIKVNINTDELNSEQKNNLEEILDLFEEWEDDENLNEFVARKVKITPSERRKRSIAYRKKRALIKQKARKYRKTAKFKKYQRKAKKMAKRGKTATGKRRVTYI